VLSAGPAPDAVRVTVRDDGPGIAAQDRPALFEAFEQVDGSATRTVGGLGLGLSFVRRIADAAGLRLVVTSTPGEGTAVALDLPTS
jgi:signal transduction histidine kinase